MGFVSWWKGEAEPTKQGLVGSFMDMPFFLKIINLSAFMFGAFSFAYCFPIENAHLNGKLITYDYVWASGIGWLFLFSGFAWVLSGYKMLRRMKYSREAYLTVMGLWMLGIGLFDSMSGREIILGVCLQLSIVGLYLFKRKPVVEYFNKAA